MLTFMCYDQVRVRDRRRCDIFAASKHSDTGRVGQQHCGKPYIGPEIARPSCCPSKCSECNLWEMGCCPYLGKIPKCGKLSFNPSSILCCLRHVLTFHHSRSSYRHLMENHTGEVSWATALPIGTLEDPVNVPPSQIREEM